MGNIRRRTGKCRYKEYNSSGTIPIDSVVQFDENGEVVAGSTGKALVGVAVKAATSSTTCVVDIIDTGSEWEFPIETGTMAAAEVGEEADINSGDGLTLTESNNDVLITGKFPCHSREQSLDANWANSVNAEMPTPRKGSNLKIVSLCNAYLMNLLGEYNSGTSVRHPKWVKIYAELCRIFKAQNNRIKSLLDNNLWDGTTTTKCYGVFMLPAFGVKTAA